MKQSCLSTYRLILPLVLIVSTALGSFGADELTVYARRDTSAQATAAGFWAVKVIFNNPVFPSNLTESTLVEANGRPIEFEYRVPRDNVKATQPANHLILVPTKVSPGSASVKVTVEKGLSDASGRRLLGKTFTYQFTTVETINVTNISTFYRDKNEKGLTLQLSDSVAENDLLKAVKLTPAVDNLKIAKVYNREFRLTGDFVYDKDYTLSISEVPLEGGSTQLAAKEFSFKGPGLKAQVSSRTQRSVVELKGRQIFPLTLANMTKIRCSLTRVPAFLIPEISAVAPKTTGPRQSGLVEKAADLKKLVDAGKLDPVFAGEVVKDSDIFFAPEGKDVAVGYSLPLSFRKNPEAGGAWITAFTDPDSGAQVELERLLQITDLSISYKLSANSLLIWVTSIYTGMPVQGVALMLSQPNGQGYFVGKTDTNGTLMVKNGKEFPALNLGKKPAGIANSALDLSAVSWVVGATASDSCAIELDTFRLKPKAITQTRSVKDKPDFRRGQVFTERGVYRPGETVHFKFVSRAYKENRIVSPAGEKVTVEIVGPRDDINYSKELTLGDFGTCYDSLETKKYFPVGTYTVKVTDEKAKGGVQAAPEPETRSRYDDDEGEENGSPNKKTTSPGVFTTTFMVQEFYKIHHYATVSIKPAKRESNQFVGLKRDEEFLSVEVKGLYYTGGPVKHGRARWKATLVPVVNPVKDFSGFMFGNEDETTRFLESGESTLDSNGALSFTVPLDSRLLTGIYGVEISATVLDINGEPATEVQTYKPKLKYRVGISGHPKQVQMGYSAPLKIVVVDSNGKKISSGKVEASVMQQQYYYVLKRDGEGNINYNWEKGWMKSFSSHLDLSSGEGVFEVNLNEAGGYMITFTFEEGTGRYASQTLFTVGWRSYDDWDRRRQQKEVVTSNEIFLSMNKKEYKAGENVQLDFSTPRPVKKCLVALERGDILDYQVIDAKDGQVSHRFPIKEGYQPNIFVSVIAAAGREGFPVYTSQADSDIPMVYYGCADISVVSQMDKLNLEIDPGVAELKGRPAEKKSISFKVTDQRGKGVATEMAVCVVDEAILALTRFITPELSSLVKFNLPLSVFAGDLRLDLVSQDLFKVLTTKPLTGGGMGFGEVNPSLRKDFRPVAYFNPALRTNEAGMATVEFKLPDSTTAYRVYAVVCDKGAGFVSGQRKMVVTKEFFIEPSIPRFLCPGDKVTFPLIVHNKTKEKGDFTLSSEGTEDVKVRLKQTSGQIEPWSASVVKASAEVTGGAERGRFLFAGKFSGPSEKYSDAVEQTFPIMSRYLPVNRVRMGSFSGKTEIPVELPAVLKKLKPEDLNPGDFSAHLSLSLTNWTKIAPGLKYLLHYPYGCIEQTSSGVIPLAGLRALVKTGTIPGISLEQVDKFLKGGVERLLSMQTSGGGFAYWPGEQFPSWWGTMYATFALNLAQQAGFDVPAEQMGEAMEFMRKGLFGKEEDLAHGNQWTKELALFNLASNKDLTPQELDVFFKEYDSLNNQAKALVLLAAQRIGYLKGDRLSALAGKLNPQIDHKRIYYYNSSYREMAICLLAAVEIVGGQSKQADQWAGDLIRNLNIEGMWCSTADTGWCLFALSKYYESKKQEKPNRFKVKIHYAGEKPTEAEVSDVTSYVALDIAKLLDKGKVTVEADSQVPVNYTLTLRYPDMITDPALLSEGFKLTKKMENLSGRDEIRVGDVIRVVLEVELRDPSKVYSDNVFEYLALEDPVPAGMVPINSELKTEGAEEQKKAPRDYGDSYGRLSDFVPSYFEFRDDGVRVFKNRAYSGNYRYSYLARAVAEGDFWMRGSRVSLMYDPQYFGRTMGKRITIMPVGK